MRPHGARWRDRIDALALGRQLPPGWTAATSAIALHLGNRARLDGTVRIGTELLAQLAGCSHDTVTRHLARLERAGLLRVTYRGNGRGHVSTYQLVLPAAAPVDNPRKGTQGADVSGQKGTHGALGKVRTMRAGSDREDRNARARGVPLCTHRVRMLAPGSCPHGCELLPYPPTSTSEPAATVTLDDDPGARRIPPQHRAGVAV